MTVNYKFKTKPYDHQRTALNAAGQKDFFGFFMEMGTGKSKVLIDFEDEHEEEQEHDGVTHDPTPPDLKKLHDVVSTVSNSRP